MQLHFEEKDVEMLLSVWAHRRDEQTWQEMPHRRSHPTGGVAPQEGQRSPALRPWRAPWAMALPLTAVPGIPLPSGLVWCPDDAGHAGRWSWVLLPSQELSGGCHPGGGKAGGTGSVIFGVMANHGVQSSTFSFTTDLENL